MGKLRLKQGRGFKPGSPPWSGAKLREEEASALFADGDTEAEVQRERRAGLGTGRPACLQCPPTPSGPRCPQASYLGLELSCRCGRGRLLRHLPPESKDLGKVPLQNLNLLE